MLDDLLTRHLDVVVCGTGAGRRSAELRQYYAGPGNRFWRTLAVIGLTPDELLPADYGQLLNFGIRLTGLAKGQADIWHDLAARVRGRKSRPSDLQPWHHR